METIWTVLLQHQRVVEMRFTEALLPFKLTTGRAHILIALHDLDGQSVYQLSQRLHIPSASAVTALLSLQRDQLVARTSLAQSFYFLTDAGRDLGEQLRPIMERANRELIAEFEAVGAAQRR